MSHTVTEVGNRCATPRECPLRNRHESSDHHEHGVGCNFNRLFVGLVSILVWVVQPALADVTGTILGTVSDPTSAVVPGAKVVLRNANVGLVRETVTAGDGSYEFLAVPVGEDYSVEVEAAGFQKSVQSSIKLLVNQRFRADFKLEVGSVQEAMTVTASAQLGDVIEDKKMQDLPLNGRSYLDLLGLQAGVVPINTTGTGEPISGDLYGGRLSVNGQREDANSFVVNGGSVEETNYNGALIVPTLDETVKIVGSCGDSLVLRIVPRVSL